MTGYYMLNTGNPFIKRGFQITYANKTDARAYLGDTGKLCRAIESIPATEHSLTGEDTNLIFEYIPVFFQLSANPKNLSYIAETSLNALDINISCIARLWSLAIPRCMDVLTPHEAIMLVISSLIGTYVHKRALMHRFRYSPGNMNSLHELQNIIISNYGYYEGFRKAMIPI